MHSKIFPILLRFCLLLCKHMDISISESALRRICTAADWDITWQPDYFAKDTKYDADIFYDLIEPQHFGFTLDERYIADDVLAGMQTCLPLNVSVMEEHFTLRTLKPYDTEKTAFRTVTLSHGKDVKTITYREEEPDYLMHGILELAKRADKQFANIAPDDEGMYWFVLLPASIKAHQLRPLSFTDPADASPASILADVTRPATQPYSYTPLFTSNLTEPPNAIGSSRIDLLAHELSIFSVTPGQTLHDAVHDDLAEHFHYTGPFKILDYRLDDTAHSKLPLLLVHIATDQFKASLVPSHDLMAHWETIPTIDIYRKHKLGFSLHTRSIE